MPYSRETWIRINKSTTGTPASKDMTTKHEELLWKTVLWAKYTYLTQRDVDYQHATRDAIDATHEWFEGLEEELPDTSVAAFTSSLNRRSWIESIQSYLGAKKGKAGVPLTYVISTTGVIDPTTPDNGPGVPSFHLDLASRGRHNGFFWQSDNNTVWRLLEFRCRGTDAWTTIAKYEATKNGTGAYRALINRYMGQDFKLLQRSKATLTINHSRYDGRSRNYTLDKHLNRYRQAFIDLGPADAPSEQRKVELFMNSWQVPGQMHLAATVRSNPKYKNSFEETATFLSGEMAANQTLNTNAPAADRSIAAVGARQSTPKSKPKCSAKSKSKGKPHKGRFTNKARRFSRGNPSAFVPSSVWKKMSKEDQQAARDRRRVEGIPSRSTLGVPSHRRILAEATNRDTQMDLREEIELLKQQVLDLSKRV